ncbi:MAG: restriction endonuclease [Croceibacterium sp.]
MSRRRRADPEWREFERLIARIEADAGPQGIVVKSPDRVRCKVTGRLREVDATIRTRAGTSDVLITIECRRRAKVQDVTWLEQLATKRSMIGADRTIAVSLSGFSPQAEAVAERLGITLRRITEIQVKDLNPLLGLDFVVFWHKRCACTGVGVQLHRCEEGGNSSERDEVDYVLPSDTDLFADIFHNTETGSSCSINSIWLEVQDSLNPYAEIENGAPPTFRTARVSYPGTVILETPCGPMRPALVFLGMAMWIEPEFVTLEQALKAQYGDAHDIKLQRVEFSSEHTKDWRVSLQAPLDATSLADIRTGGNWPTHTEAEPDD